ncbi:MAG TPA: histidine phosphatase family protein, partial [Candidatus Bathyarchaeia archaeon]|nr:histidine phosphatase family protein [Candidatus Bathyarchaeia archaeon]
MNKVRLRGASASSAAFRCFRPRVCATLAAIACFAFAFRSDAGLKVYYLRHAEGGHNVVKEWANVPKEQRPDYVGNANVFTPKGKEQVVAATEKLQKYHFDFIAVSSMWRTRNTVLPYLKAIGTKGEIWPELHEFGGG